MKLSRDGCHERIIYATAQLKIYQNEAVRVGTVCQLIPARHTTPTRPPSSFRCLQWWQCTVVICTDLSDNESWRLGGIMVSTVVQNARGMGSNPALRAIDRWAWIG